MVRTTRSDGASVVAGLALLAVLLASDAFAQCSMCRTALEGPEAGRLAEKLNSGILFLLGAPFGVAAAVGVSMVRSWRRLEEHR